MRSVSAISELRHIKVPYQREKCRYIFCNNNLNSETIHIACTNVCVVTYAIAASQISF